MYYFITILLLLLFTVYSFKRVNQKRLQDSPLKRRGILNIAEQITLVRLNTILPEHTVLAHVAFDALLTTKYAHTRRKYQGLMADFVILDHQYQVLAIIEIVDESYVNRLHQKVRSHRTQCRLPLLVCMRFQDLFHSPHRGSFRLSLTVLVHYRSVRSI